MFHIPTTVTQEHLLKLFFKTAKTWKLCFAYHCWTNVTSQGLRIELRWLSVFLYYTKWKKLHSVRCHRFTSKSYKKRARCRTCYKLSSTFQRVWNSQSSLGFVRELWIDANIVSTIISKTLSENYTLQPSEKWIPLEWVTRTKSFTINLTLP